MVRANLKPVWFLGGGPNSNPSHEKQLIHKIFQDWGMIHPRIAYIGSASNDNKTFFSWISKKLKDSGAREVFLAKTTGLNWSAEKFKESLEDADIIFISGGDVAEGMKVLEEKKLVAFLRELHQKGKAFMGVSAGTIMLCKSWVKWSDPENESTAEIFSCLGIVEIYTDTHAEEDRWSELKTLLTLVKDQKAKGYGIPSGGALRISPQGGIESFGYPTVVMERKEKDITLSLLESK